MNYDINLIKQPVEKLRVRWAYPWGLCVSCFFPACICARMHVCIPSRVCMACAYLVSALLHSIRRDDYHKRFMLCRSVIERP